MRRQSTPRLRLGRPLSAVGGAVSHLLAAAALATALSTAALTVTPSGGGTITPSTTASRVSGVAPLAVHFDYTATTATGVARPFHELFHRTNFDDPAGGATWDTGIFPGVLSRNVAYGPVAGHLFMVPGVYDVEHITYRPTGGGTFEAITEYITITVTDPDVEWAGSKTIYLSTGTDFTGVPGGAVTIGSVTNMGAQIAAAGANKRILLKRGETFPQTTNMLINQAGPSMVGAWGSGAKPIIRRDANVVMMNLSSPATPTTVSDWRFVDLVLEGNSYASSAVSGEGSCKRMVFSNCDLRNVHYGYTFSGSVMNGVNSAVPFTHAPWDEIYIVGGSTYNLTIGSGPCAIFGGWERMVVLGLDIDNNSGGEHGIRTQYASRCVFSANTIRGIAVGKANMTIRGPNFAGDNTLAAGTYSEKNVISDNRFVGGASGGLCGCGPQNSFNDERGRNMIWERNYYIGSASGTSAQTNAQPDVTFRYNLFQIQSGECLKMEKSGMVPAPTNTAFYGNTAYTSGSSQFIMVNVAINTVGSNGEFSPAASVPVLFGNNLAYCPNASGTSKMIDNLYGTGVITQAGNSGDTQMRTTSPIFATTPPTQPSHFKPQAGSYAIAGGSSSVPMCWDVAGVQALAALDIGAYVH